MTAGAQVVFPANSKQSWTPQLGRVRMSNFMDVTVATEPEDPYNPLLQRLPAGLVVLAVLVLIVWRLRSAATKSVAQPWWARMAARPPPKRRNSDDPAAVFTSGGRV